MLLGMVDGLLLDLAEVLKSLRNARTRKDDEDETLLIVGSVEGLTDCLANVDLAYKKFNEIVWRHQWIDID